MNPELNGSQSQTLPNFEIPGFDINAAFQGAISDIVSDEESAVVDKIQRMEAVVKEGTSELYREFVDFTSMAAQIEMFCNHNHLSEGLSDNLSSFLQNNSNHEHDHSIRSHNQEDEDEDDKKAKSKNKRQKTFTEQFRSLFGS